MLTGWLAHPSIHPFIQSFVEHTCTPSPVGLAVKGGGGRAGQQEFPPPPAESSPNPHTSESTKAPRGGVSVVSWLHRRRPGATVMGAAEGRPSELGHVSCSAWPSLKGLDASALGAVSTPGLMSCGPLGT